MARPGFLRHPKFKLLVRLLNIPEAHALGHVEMLWGSAYETGVDVVGDDMMIEAAAGWTGEPGKLCAALLECGGKGRTGLIERADDGQYRIHDLYDHAPDYVQARRQREEERSVEKRCEGCGMPFRSSDPRAKYCRGACRSAAYRGRGRDTDRHTDLSADPSRDTDRHGSKRNDTDSHTTPAPAPAPAPAIQTISDRDGSIEPRTATTEGGTAAPPWEEPVNGSTPHNADGELPGALVPPLPIGDSTDGSTPRRQSADPPMLPVGGDATDLGPNLLAVSDAVEWFEWARLGPDASREFRGYVGSLGVPAVIEALRTAKSKCAKERPRSWLKYALEAMSSAEADAIRQRERRAAPPPRRVRVDR